MPRRRSGQPPKYRHHKARDLAKVTIDRRDIYLGAHNSPESWQKYADVLAGIQKGLSVDEIIASLNGDVVPETNTPSALRSPAQTTVGQLSLQFFEHARVYYAPRENGSGGRIANVKVAMREVNNLFSGVDVTKFGPLKFITVRDAMVARGLERNYINDLMSIITLMFNWGVERELVPVDVLTALRAVRSLRKDKTEAHERDKVEPVPIADYEKTLPFLRPVVRDMVQLHLLTGSRPGEIRVLKPQAVDRRCPEVWCYFLEEHKTDRFNKERRIFIGPEAQQILLPYLDRAPDAFCFTTGKKPVRPYTKDSYCRAISRACSKAEVDHWSPRQLRHSRATLIREMYGVEAAQAILGHSTAKVTEIYAERNFKQAADIMKQIG